MASSDYRTIVGEGHVETVIKGSRFIGIAMGCRDESELAENLARMRREYPEAPTGATPPHTEGTRGSATTGSRPGPPGGR